MKRIILFRFSKEPSICENRLELLRQFNPTVPVYGIFGGEDNEAEAYSKKLEPYLEHFWSIKNKTKSWKWRNIDLALRNWYREIGATIDFDMAHLIEWDLLLTKPLEEIYQHIHEEEIGITGLVPLHEIEEHWSWTHKEPEKTEWLTLISFVREKYSYSQKPFASLGPGTCYPRSFLEHYAFMDVPELCHDEIRVPLFAQIIGTPLRDTGFYREWFSEAEKESFNCNGIEIPIKKVLQETKDGMRYAFHPVRDFFPLDFM